MDYSDSLAYLLAWSEGGEPAGFIGVGNLREVVVNGSGIGISMAFCSVRKYQE